MAFHGTFEHSLDAKNRLTVPSKLRAAFSEGAFLVKAADRCISLYPSATYSALTDAALSGMNPLSAQARELKRYFHSNAQGVELDSAGRVMIGARQLDHAGIGRDVVVIGAGDCLELWDPSTWVAYDQDLTARGPDITASLGHPA
ncbi:MAG: division/cell wall cluster transcriptional repressor MraZ [Solirubrobacteraceae bacterium]